MASQDPWPFMPPQSTELLLMHCDDTAYTATPDTILYKLVDAICGTTGAGALVNEIFLARAAGALETIYYNDLDYIFSKVNFLARAPEESYPYNPLVDSLTADQWNEVRTKDAWYRARVRDFFVACGLGTTLPGIQMCVQAALAVACDVFEVWRYCADEETEILTRTGYKHHCDLAKGEEVLTLNLDTDMAEWQPVIAVNRFEVDNEPMLSLEAPGHSSLTTLDHRWPVRRRAGAQRRYQNTIRRSYELTTEDSLIRSAPVLGLPDQPKHLDALVELVAWFLTEGHIHAGRAGKSSALLTIVQSHVVNPEKVQAIRAALNRLLGSAVPTFNKKGRRLDQRPAWREWVSPSKPNITVFRLNSVAGRSLLDLAPNKVATTEFISSLTEAQLKLFVDTCIAADGYVRKDGYRSFVQKSLDRIEPVRLAATLLGIPTSIQRPGKEGQCYVLSLNERRRYIAPHREHARQERYTGIVWCPTTANGTWFARRRETTYFTGNTDGFGVPSDLGRSPHPARNELVVKPHKQSLAPQEFRLVRDMLDKMVTLDTIVTVDVDGLSVHTPIQPSSAAADSTYYEVQKVITPTPLMSQLPPPELLPIDLLPSETWMFSSDPVLAPYAAFNITSEYSYFYLMGGGKRSPIDSVTYGIINSPTGAKISVFEMFGTSTVSGQVVTSPPTSMVADALSADLFQYNALHYQADMYPPSDAIDAGVATLISAINACAGSFVLVGHGLGAVICSEVYDEIRSGSLTNRSTQFLGGVVFGNARRQPGRTFPGSTYTHGQGVYGNHLLTGTEDRWWEFVVPGDIIADVTTSARQDQWYTTLFETFFPNYSGNISAIVPMISPPIPVATQLMQTLIDTYYGQEPNDAHTQYTLYQPLLSTGDYRTCTQMAGDYIAGLAGKRLALAGASLSAYPVCVYEVGGPELTSATDSWFSGNLDDRMKYIWTSWPVGTTLPTATAIATGVNNLLTQINRNPGKFCLIGRGLGAVVVDQVYNQLQAGGLQHRAADLLGVVAIGSPVRQLAHTFPDCPDPGGHGISATRMTGTVPSLWWDFADANDPLAVEVDDTNGTWMSTLYDAVVANYTGSLNAITSAYPSAPVNVSLLTSRIVNILFAGAQQVDYSLTTPLASAGDLRTSFEIARDYLNTFATQSIPYVAGPVDVLDTYQPEANFESFTPTSNYGPWQTYEIADSPDNYPGGKFGLHSHAAPAVNPDGTPYNFPWASQAAYITFKSAQVIAMGGQADSIRFRLPTSVSSVSKEVFLPEYAIAYTAPAMDSTVSKSLTARRTKTVSQRGSNVNFARVNT